MDIVCEQLIDRRREPSLLRNADADVRAVVLHQTAIGAFLSPDDPDDSGLSERRKNRIGRIPAHFVILQNGLIYYIRDVSSEHAGRRRAVDIEFSGAFPHGDEPDQSARVPVEMLRSGRRLVRALVGQMANVTHIHPHGQVQNFTGRGENQRLCGDRDHENPCGKLESCPGPDIWVNVGEWACLSEGEGGLGLICNPVLSGMGFPRRGIDPAQSNEAYRLDVL